MGSRRRKARSVEETRTASVTARGGATATSAGDEVTGSLPGRANPAYGEREVCEHARALYWRLTGRAMRRDPETGLGRFEWMAESEENIGVVERRAARVWLAGGSWKGEKLRRREREERRAKRLIAEQARRFVTFMRQGGGQARWA